MYEIYGHRTHIAVIRHPHLDAYEIALFERRDGVTSVISKIEMSELENGHLAPHPPSPLMIEEGTAQELMDELWRVGLRPIEGHGSVGAMQQAEKHIASLQTQVAALTRIIEQLMAGKQ